MRCVHVQHKRSVVPYAIDGGKKLVAVNVVLGFNNLHHRYEYCDEGLMPATRLPKPKKKAPTQED